MDAAEINAQQLWVFYEKWFNYLCCHKAWHDFIGWSDRICVSYQQAGGLKAMQTN